MKNLQKKLLSQLIILIVSITVFCIKIKRKILTNQYFDSESESPSNGVSVSFDSLK